MPLRTANIIGSGPNGLAAAITLAQAGVAVTVYERNPRIGGACSTAEVTLPGFHHDLGSSAYPLGVASPFFQSRPLASHGLRWIQAPSALAHPLDDGTAVTLEAGAHDGIEGGLEATAAQFSAHDARAWRNLFGSSVREWPKLVNAFTRSLLRVPRHPIALANFGTAALWPAQALARTVFQDERARALFAGCAAHSVLPLTRVASAATGLVLATAGMTTGWPIAAGGAQAITNALASFLRTIGGTILTGNEVTDLRDLPAADATFFDTGTAALNRIAGNALSPAFRNRLRHFHPGAGMFKLDFALSAPIPWKAAACSRAATVHLGGTLAEVAASEAASCAVSPGRARLSDRPFVLLVQPSLFDPTRAPARQHTAWAYCHVPFGSNADRTAAIEQQIERFAPGFRDCILARRASNAKALAAWNPNLRGADVSGGAMTLTQLLARPTLRQYRTSNPRLYLCSASTPPGGGVHGMCGHMAALAALADLS